MDVLVLVPAFNEAVRIAPVVKRVREAGFPVLVVDDGSSDGTARAAREAGAEVLESPKNEGKGAALRRGFRWALERPYAAVVMMDADGQHDPSELRVFKDALEKKTADFLIGDRMRDPAGMPPVRKLTNAVMSGLISAIARRRVNDSQCGYRAITREALASLDLRTSRYEIETEMILETARLGWRIGSVPIGCHYGEEISRVRPLTDTVRFFKFLAAYARRPKAR
jgi:glycosyltransferase involved in cell wall biosynthesis